MRFVRRGATVLALAAGLFAVVALGAAPLASAHPLGNFTINRYADIDLAPGDARLTYILDMAEIPTFTAMPAIDANRDGTASAAERQAWADRTAPQVLSRLRLLVNAQPVTLRVVSDSMIFRPGQAGLPILYFRALFAGPVMATSGAVGFTDQNYSDRIGWKEITAHSEDGVSVVDSSVRAGSLSDQLQSYPVDMLSSPLDVRQATFSFHPGPATTAGAATAGGPRVAGAPVASGRSFAALIQWRLTPVVLIASLLFAFLFGAVHALGPGHGKTITAAYLVGARAKRRQAMTIGAAVSVMHTGSVLALGLVAYVLLKTFPADRVYPWLTLVTGVVALGLGLGLMVARVRARRRGADPWHGHTHPRPAGAGADDATPAGPAVVGALETAAFAAEAGSAGPGSAVMVLERAPALESHHHDHHGHPDAHPHLGDGREADHHHHAGDREPVEPVSSRGLLALAVAGGILPSPTAFVVLTGAIRYHRLGYGLGLIAAFSIGLAAALIAVGTVALRAQSFMNRRVGWRVSSLIPILSAGVIVGFGAFFAARGLHSGFDGALALAVTVGILAGTAGAVLSARGSRRPATA